MRLEQDVKLFKINRPKTSNVSNVPDEKMLSFYLGQIWTNNFTK